MSDIDRFLDGHEKRSRESSIRPEVRPAEKSPIDRQKNESRGDGLSIDEFLQHAPAQDKGVTGVAKDLGLGFLGGAAKVPGSALAAVDSIATGGKVSKAIDDAGMNYGEQIADRLAEHHTEKYKQQQQGFAEAGEGKDLAGRVVDKAAYALTNPSLIAGTIAQSLPDMIAGGAAGGKLAKSSKGKMSAGAGAALGEGVMMMGHQAEEVRSQTEDGTLTPEQRAYVLGTGALGALFGWGGNRLAQKLGIADVDTLIAKGMSPQEIAANIAQMPAKSVPKALVQGAISEGFLEELPQEVSETILGNLALDRDWSEGLDDAVVMAPLAGMAMGGPVSGYGAYRSNKARAAEKKTDEAGQERPPEQSPKDLIDDPSQNSSSHASSQSQDEYKGEGFAFKPSEYMGINPDDGPLSSAAATAVDSEQPQPLESEFYEQQQRKRHGTERVDLSSLRREQEQRPTKAKEIDPVADAASAWASMNSFERTRVAQDTMGKRGVLAKNAATRNWEELSDADREAVTKAVSEERKNTQWNDPNRASKIEDKPVLQNRDRSSRASIEQMNSIAGNPDYSRLSFSRDFGNGAPVVEQGAEVPQSQLGATDTAATSQGRQIPIQYAALEAGRLLASNNADGSPNSQYASGEEGLLRAIAGNGRVAGLQSAWDRGTATQYKQAMLSDQIHGIDSQVIESMDRPVLVRIMPSDQVTENIGDESNISGQSGLSSVERAQTDMRRLDLSLLEFGEDGDISAESAASFINSMPVSERAELLDGDRPSRRAIERLEAAVFQQAYGNDELTRLQAEAVRGEARNIVSSLMQAAPSMSKLEGAGIYDIRPLIAEAAEVAINARRSGQPLKQYIEQQDFGRNPEILSILGMMAEDYRSAKGMGDKLKALAQLSYSEGNKPSSDMFGEVPKADPQQIMEAAFTGKELQVNGQEITREVGQQAGPRNYAESATRPATDRRRQEVLGERPQQQTGEEPKGIDAWRGNYIQAARVARELGINPKQHKSLSDLAAAIDAHNAEPLLETYSEQDLAQQEDAKQQLEREEAQARQRANKAVKQQEERDFVRSQSTKAAETFELGQDAEENITGQSNMFSEQPTSEDIDAVAQEVNTDPSDGQKEAGNYKKAHVKIHGLDIAIENPKGSKRSGVDEDGNAWSVEMRNHYGYIKRTEGADGDQIDVFIGDNPESKQVFIVDQINQDDGSFDEHKVMLGFTSRIQAINGYRANYSKGWKVGKIKQQNINEFKYWISDGDTTKPAQDADPKKNTEINKIDDGKVVLFSRGEGGYIPGSTLTNSDSFVLAVEAQFPSLGEATRKLLQLGEQGRKGGVVFIEGKSIKAIAKIYSEKTGIPLAQAEALLADADTANGFYDVNSGITFLIGGNLNENNAAAVLLHEMLHSDQRENIDRMALDLLASRDSTKDKNLKDFIDRVERQLAEAGESFNPLEAATYIVEQAVLEGRSQGYTLADNKFLNWVEKNIGKPVADLIRNLVKSVRQWMLRNDIGIQEVTIDDLVQYSINALEANARQVGGREVIAFTDRAGQSIVAEIRQSEPAKDSEVRGLVEQYIGEDGSPSEREIRQAIEQYRSTEKRIGGRKAYDNARSEGKTELNYLQWVQVRTPAFKEWFGDWEDGRYAQRGRQKNEQDYRRLTGEPPEGSKQAATASTAKDTRGGQDTGRNRRIPDVLIEPKTGEPRVFYHGTKDDFSLFDLSHPNRKDAGWFGRGVYVSSDVRMANAYADLKTGNNKANIMPLFVRSASKVYSTTLKQKQTGSRLSQENIDQLTAEFRKGGYDGAFLKYADGTIELVTFDTTNIKSATGNIGTFNSNQADIRYSRRAAASKVNDFAEQMADRIDGWTNKKRTTPSDWTNAQKQAASKFDTFSPRQPISARLRQIKEVSGKRFMQLVFDQFRPLQDLSSKAFMQAHLSRGSEGSVEAIATQGVPYLKDGAIAVHSDENGFMGKLAKLGDMEEVRKFFMWVSAQRAESLMAEGRENLFTAEDIEAMKGFANGKLNDGKIRRVEYGNMLKELNKYNKAVLDIAQEAGLINGEARKSWESEFYIPFYRVMQNDDGTVSNKFSHSDDGLMRQEVIKRLKGGKENLGDPLENILSNWNSLISASMKNMAANEALTQGVELGISEPTNQKFNNQLWTMQDGKRVYWNVHDKNVLEALESLNFSGYSNGLMKAAGKFKRMLTTGVTYSPTFRIRSLIRDTLHGMAVSDLSYNPLANMLNGWGKTSKNSEVLAQMMAGGGAIRFGSMEEGQSADYMRRMIKEGKITKEQILNTPEKFKNAISDFMNSYQELGDRMESVNRAEVYTRVLNKTGSHLEASFAARDVMNYTSMGSAAIIRAMAQVLPFFNARMQGLNKLARGANEDPKRFWGVVGTIGMASALLYLMQAGDDEYDALPDYVRDTYWPIKLGDKWLYIPKPFEVGVLGTVVERATELVVAGDDYQSKDFARTLGSLLINNLSLNPVPQILLPATEAWYNYDTFRGAPIDSMAMQRLMPEDRYTANTSAGAVFFGNTLGASPQKIEHLVTGYFGWLGVQALNVSDMLGRTMMDLPSSTKWDMTQTQNWFIAGDFLKQEGSTPSKYSNRFYEVQREINQIYATATSARGVGNMDRYRELMEEPKMQARPHVSSANNRINLINRQIKNVTADRQMSSSEKTDRLRELYQRRESIAKTIDQRSRAS